MEPPMRSQFIKIRIRITDCLNLLNLKLKLNAHRLIFRTKFLSPELHCTLLAENLPTHLEIPGEFWKLWNNRREKHYALFPSEASFKYTCDSPIKILKGRYIQIAERTFLDAGKQAKFRFRELEEDFVSEGYLPAKTVVVPWGLGTASYGDFIIQVLPKLCRLITTIPAADREQIFLCLPEFSSFPWAREYLHMVGIGENQIHDGNHTVKVSEGGNIFVGTGPSAACHIAHPDDLLIMRELITPHFPETRSKPHRRIYISRRTGRAMQNEVELIPGLEERGFEILSLEGLSVREQIGLFREACFIVGPHGAGHANLMWSAPGTTLLEVFHPSWMHPCYGILASLMGLHYHCLVGESGLEPGEWSERSRYGIFENPEISPEVFFGKIDSLLSK